MSHDYDEGRGRGSSPRSRKNPNMRSTGDSSSEGLKVMNDASIHEVKPARTAQADTSGGGTARRASGASRQTSAARTAAASAGGNGKNGLGSGGSGMAGSGGSGMSLRQERRMAKRRKRRRMIAMIVAECFALVLIFGYAHFLKKLNEVQRPPFERQNIQNENLTEVTMEKLKGYWTIAVFGVDARDNTISKSTNSDVNIICNINLETGEIKLVSLFRDTYLNISKNGSYNKFNQAYFVGGPEQAVSAMNRNLDLDIKDYVTFNWKAVADAINILGGVDVELSKAEFYYINSFITETVKATGVGSHQLTHAGMNHLDGVQAVAYGRLRLMDTDYARTERQRKIIKLAFEKAKQADFDTLNRVLGTVFPQVATSLWVDDIFVTLKNINKYHLGETTGFPQARGNLRMGKKGDCVIPQTLETNVVKLHEFLFGDENYQPSDTVKSISAKISADSGMYKEGNYVDSVGTEGGVIQKPKATAPAKSDDDEKNETKKSTEGSKKETDEDGKPVEQETDEDGNPIGGPEDEDPEDDEPETDRYGRPLNLRPGETLKESDEDETDEEEPETDRYGRPINLRPGETQAPTRPSESVSDRPGTSTHPGTTPESTAANRPGSTPESTAANRPGGPTESTAATRPGNSHTGTSDAPGTTPESTAANRPGSTPESTAANRPGTTTESTAATHPGSTGSQAPGTSTSPSGSSTPGGTNPSGSQAPGSGVSNAPGSSSSVSEDAGGGPGSQGSGSGPVAGPGQ